MIGDRKYMTNDLLIPKGTQEDTAVFQVRFSRCHRLLHFIAARILRSPEKVDHAIENCWRTASRNPPRFKHESAFRSWLLRVLINEALEIRRQNEDPIQLRTSLERIRAAKTPCNHIRDAKHGIVSA
jgi:RNA polymerase sigma-70 factor, ECF subfamily